MRGPGQDEGPPFQLVRHHEPGPQTRQRRVTVAANAGLARRRVDAQRARAMPAAAAASMAPSDTAVGVTSRVAKNRNASLLRRSRSYNRTAAAATSGMPSHST